MMTAVFLRNRWLRVLWLGLPLLNACGSSKPKASAPSDASAAVDSPCPRIALTSESGEGWLMGSDTCLDLWPAADRPGPTTLAAGHGPCAASSSSAVTTVQLVSKAPPFGAAEGRVAQCLEVKDEPGGMALRLLEVKNISQFAGGSLVFELAADSIDRLTVGMAWTGGQRDLPLNSYVSGVKSNGWTRVSIPLAELGVELAAVTHPFKMSAQIAAGQTRVWCVDDVHLEAPCGSASTDARSGGADTSGSGSSSLDGRPSNDPGDIWSTLVPAACLPDGESAPQQIFGIFLDAKQDARFSQGEASIGWWDSGDDAGAILPETAVKPTVPAEGTHLLCVGVSQGSGSTFVAYDSPRDFSSYRNGYLESELFGDADVLVGVSWLPVGSTTEQRKSVRAATYVVATASSGWKTIRIPLCVFGAELGRLKAIATFAVEGRTSPTTFCVDAVRFRKPSSSCSDTCNGTAVVDGGDGGTQPTDADVRADRVPDLPIPDAPTMDAWTCPVAPVPAECLLPATDPFTQIWGILFECKQDLRLDQAGEASVGWWGSTSDAGGILTSTAVQPTAPAEGTNMLCATVNQGSGSAFIYYDNPRDFSAYRDGYLEAEIFGDADVLIGVSWLPAGATTEQRKTVSAAEHVVGSAMNGWKRIRIPLCLFGADLARLKAVATFGVEGIRSPTTFCADAVRLRKSSPSCSDACAAAATVDSGVDRAAVDAHSDDLAMDLPGADVLVADVDGGTCPVELVPSQCLAGGDAPPAQVWGILLECKQDARIDEAGEAKVGWWESYSRGGEILADAAVKPTTPVEGTRMVCVALRQGSGSAFVYYETPRDFSAYANGYLEAELFGAADVEIGVSWIPAGSTTEQRNSVPAADYVVASAASGWKSIRIPLCVLGADLGRLKAIATFTVQQPASPITFCVDAIRFRKASSLCQATCGRSADFGTAETALRSL